MTKILRDIVPLNELTGKGKLMKIQKHYKAKAKDQWNSGKVGDIGDMNVGSNDDYESSKIHYLRAKKLRAIQRRKKKGDFQKSMSNPNPVGDEIEQSRRDVRQDRFGVEGPDLKKMKKSSYKNPYYSKRCPSCGRA